MNSYGKMIQANMISFNNALLTNYRKIGLDEVDMVIISLLYNQKVHRNDFLSIRSLKRKMTIDEKTLSERIYRLVETGYVELLIEDDKKEQFSLEPTINKLGLCFEEENGVDSEKASQELLHKMIQYVELTYQRTLSPSDLTIINSWIDEGYCYDQMTEAVLESLKARRTHLKYADAILVSRKEREKVVNIDPKLKEVLSQVYVKKR